MSTLKKGLCVILALSMMVGLTACREDKFTNEDFIKAAEELGIDEYDDKDDLYSHFTPRDLKDGYITGTDDIAIDFYSDIVNRFDQYSNAMPTEFSVIVTGEEGADYLYFITFKDEKKAQKFFDEYIDDAEVELLEKKGVEYASNYNEFEDHTNTYSAYHKDNKVMVIICLPQSDYEEEFIEDFCEILELPSPLED